MCREGKEVIPGEGQEGGWLLIGVPRVLGRVPTHHDLLPYEDEHDQSELLRGAVATKDLAGLPGGVLLLKAGEGEGVSGHGGPGMAEGEDR